MTKHIKYQRGFLLIIAIVAIVIIGTITTTLTYMHISSTRAATDTLQSTQALYIAKAGLEIAKRDLITGIIDCNDISTKYNPTNGKCYPPNASTCLGYFTVAGVSKNTSATLQGNHSETITTITLDGASNLMSPSGIVTIGQEAIWYPSISGDALTNVKRGLFGTTILPTTLGGSKVYQNTCTLTATGSIPNIQNPAPNGQRVITETLVKTPAPPRGNYVDKNGHKTNPMMVAGGYVLLYGETRIPFIGGSAYVQNSYVTKDSEIPGSTISSGGDVFFIGKDAYTMANGNVISQGNKNPLNPPTYGADISSDNRNNSNINSAGLWARTYTNNPDKTTYKNSLPTSSVITGSKCSQLGSYDFTKAPSVLWINCGDITEFNRPSIQIGSQDHPVNLIIEGDVNWSNNIDIYGSLYVAGNLNSTNLRVYGPIAVEGNIILGGIWGGHSEINYDPLNYSYLCQYKPSDYITREEFKKPK